VRRWWPTRAWTRWPSPGRRRPAVGSPRSGGRSLRRVSLELGGKSAGGGPRRRRPGAAGQGTPVRVRSSQLAGLCRPDAESWPRRAGTTRWSTPWPRRRPPSPSVTLSTGHPDRGRWSAGARRERVRGVHRRAGGGSGPPGVGRSAAPDGLPSAGTSARRSSPTSDTACPSPRRDLRPGVERDPLRRRPDARPGSPNDSPTGWPGSGVDHRRGTAAWPWARGRTHRDVRRQRLRAPTPWRPSAATGRPVSGAEWARRHGRVRRAQGDPRVGGMTPGPVDGGGSTPTSSNHPMSGLDGS